MAVYYQFIQLGMTAYIGFKVGFEWWVILLAIPVFLIAYVFETRFGITAEMDIVWRASTEWKEFKERDDEFKRKIISLLAENDNSDSPHVGVN